MKDKEQLYDDLTDSWNMNDIMEALNKEIQWHKDNKGITDKGKKWERGFIKGLGHARCVLGRLMGKAYTEAWEKIENESLN